MNGWVGIQSSRRKSGCVDVMGLWWGWMMGDGALAGATVTVAAEAVQ